MEDELKTKEQLIIELRELRRQATNSKRILAENSRIEQRLKEREEKWHLLAQTTPVYIMTVDREGIIQILNRTTRGLILEQVIGTSIFDYVEQEQINILKKSVDNVFRTGEFDSYEILGLGPQGSRTTWYESHLGPVVDNTGKVVAVTIMAIDITDRKQVEEELKETLNRFNCFLNNMPDMAWLKDTDSKFILANGAFYSTVGIEKENLIDNTCEICFGKEMSERCNADDRMVLESKKQVIIEERIVDAQGNTVLLETIKAPVLAESGEAIGTIGIARDVTIQKKMEKELRQSQKMAAIGTLAGGIAHEFNNLLFMITGNLGLLKNKLSDEVYEQCKRPFNSISGATDRAVNLVRQILTFSRKGEKTIEKVDLVKIIKDGLTMMRATLPATIEIVDHVNLNNGIVRADSTQMLQILINLCTNAKYVLQNRGGIMEVGLLSEVKDGKPYLKLSVGDNGPGMPPEVKQRAFEPFFTTKPVGEGIGMGLPVVHGIVEDSGGHVEIDSVEGKGTSVHVFLPDCTEK